jgi:hypothetical protein
MRLVLVAHSGTGPDLYCAITSSTPSAANLNPKQGDRSPGGCSTHPEGEGWREAVPPRGWSSIY